MLNNKTKKKLKMMAMVMALSIPMAATAQGGLFQRGDEPAGPRNSGAAALTNQGFGNPLDGSIVTNQTFGNPTDGVNVTNQTFGAPLGSGLFTLLLASVGYAAINKQKKQQKQKGEYKMKKISIILTVFALAMTMSQCKKNEGQTTSNDEVVTITLDVKQNNDSKVVVNPNTGTVDFETGDKIYVGSGGKYVGFLTHNGINFSGNITNPTEDQPLQFYFLGNVTPQETLSAGTTEECSVIISDQTEHLPVISCAASNENYVSGVTAYSAHLLNKCALVKFNVTTPSNSPICITGMKNKVTVDFTQNTMTPSMDGEGVIMLPAGSGENVEKWAILLTQEALEEGEEGSAYSEDGVYIGTRPAILTIADNGYFPQGISFEVSNAVVSDIPIGAINGLFSVNDTKQVYFSQGNLQYQASTNTWRFAENQWDYVGTQAPDNNGNVGGTVNGSDNANISSNYSSWIDLFGWGTSGWNSGNAYYHPWDSNNSDGSLYGPPERYYGLTGSYANADWGVYNSISNGSNTTNQWRTLTQAEWDYVFNSRNTTSGIRYAMAKVNNVNGVILLPDGWSSSTYSLSNTNIHYASFSSNTISNYQWTILESAGAVFLPAAGFRSGTRVNDVGFSGRYWSATHDWGTNNFARLVYFIDSLFSANTNMYRYYGLSVRLAQDY